MKIAIALLTTLSALCIILGVASEQTGRSQDEKLGSLVPYMFGVLFLAIDFALVVGWGVYKLWSL